MFKIFKMLILRLRLKKLLILLTSSVCFVLLLILVKNRSSMLSPHLKEIKLDRKVRSPMPGIYINSFQPSNNSFCKFKYGLPRKLSFQTTDLKYSPQLQETSSYQILYNVIESKLNVSKNSVTFATHVTPHFVNFLAELVKYWDGVISVAVFVPDFDASLVINSITKLCYCLPNMVKVSMHFVFPKNRQPIVENDSIITSCDVYDLRKIKTFRDREGLPYPVNICRNAARKAVKTTYSLVADVELMPSANLSDNFIKMLKSFRSLDRFRNYVFVIPVFEVINTFFIGYLW